MIAAWEIHASDIDASAAFYAGPLGWSIEDADWDGHRFLRVKTNAGDPIGRIIKRHGDAPQPGAPVMGGVLTFAVADLDATIAAFAAQEAVMAMPRFLIEGEGFAAYFLDPDRNVFGLFEALS